MTREQRHQDRRSSGNDFVERVSCYRRLCHVDYRSRKCNIRRHNVPAHDPILAVLFLLNDRIWGKYYLLWPRHYRN